jgi:hypothetical protein
MVVENNADEINVKNQISALVYFLLIDLKILSNGMSEISNNCNGFT